MQSPDCRAGAECDQERIQNDQTIRRPDMARVLRSGADGSGGIDRSTESICLSHRYDHDRSGNNLFAVGSFTKVRYDSSPLRILIADDDFDHVHNHQDPGDRAQD